MSSSGGGGANEGNSRQANSESGSGSVAVSGSGSKKISKNAPGNKSDVAWSHGTCIDGNARKIKCNYCQKVITGSVYRLKHHLAGTQKDVGACKVVPEEVKKQMRDIVVSLQQNLIKKTRDVEEGGATNDDDDDCSVGEKRKGKEVEAPSNLFKRKGISTQSTINSIFKKNLREEACQEIASFFYNNAIPFNVAKSEEYIRMFEKVARHDLGFKPPSYHELS